ncbi:MAG: hypothetical protein OTJ97_04245, partial [SAR202 cluster bacterium]|nr:hypothetical protein [SAR202 cluster bacterium]
MAKAKPELVVDVRRRRGGRWGFTNKKDEPDELALLIQGSDAEYSHVPKLKDEVKAGRGIVPPPQIVGNELDSWRDVTAAGNRVIFLCACRDGRSCDAALVAAAVAPQGVDVQHFSFTPVPSATHLQEGQEEDETPEDILAVSGDVVDKEAPTEEGPEGPPPPSQEVFDYIEESHDKTKEEVVKELRRARDDQGRVVEGVERKEPFTIEATSDRWVRQALLRLYTDLLPNGPTAEEVDTIVVFPTLTDPDLPHAVSLPPDAHSFVVLSEKRPARSGGASMLPLSGQTLLVPTGTAAGPSLRFRSTEVLVLFTLRRTHVLDLKSAEMEQEIREGTRNEFTPLLYASSLLESGLDLEQAAERMSRELALPRSESKSHVRAIYEGTLEVQRGLIFRRQHEDGSSRPRAMLVVPTKVLTRVLRDLHVNTPLKHLDISSMVFEAAGRGLTGWPSAVPRR